ncbi:hypothetical protein H072_5794 [Dactylellina haptotyla CBS 200.50]|uniref:Autophagy-related protein 27 n=1 Tax=Dactylellina haptotyla (strain CBS 200.50) TaxID=1284197 RepID=S8BLT2_DACHA|nr:hypothetical protein H072_5794 [Dactylellina haptotyla CBS 200.50]
MQFGQLICCIFIVLFPAFSFFADGYPIRHPSLVPNRQRHWTGLYYTNPAYARAKPPTPTAEHLRYLEFVKRVASGKYPGVTFRPDSWSQYNAHPSRRSQTMTAAEMSSPPAPSVETVILNQGGNDITSAPCNVSLTPNNYCAKTLQQLADEDREQRRGLFVGTAFTALFALILSMVYFLSYNFYRYFEYKERWHVERARCKSIRRVNLGLVKTGIDKPFPENLDMWILTHPPSTFWAGLFESEWFIALLHFIERRTKMKGKYTGLMKRPKLGDESSGIPLNSPRARRKYGRRGPPTPAVPQHILDAHACGLPTPLGSIHRRSRSSRSASIYSRRLQSGADPVPDIEPIRDGNGNVYTMPSGFDNPPSSVEREMAINERNS